MPEFSRRDFFRKAATDTAAAGILSAGVLNLRANPLGMPIGSQTYSHRQRIKDGDLAGLCKDMVSIGVGALELCSPAYAEFAVLADGKQTRRILDDNGIKCPSCHFEMSELRTKQNEAIAWAKDLGMTQMGTSTLGQPGGHGGPGLPGMDADVIAMDVIKRAADEYNKIGEVAAKAGLQQFVHNEGFELKKAEDGRFVYQILLELFDAKLVKMQFQMSAMRTIGDPVMWFNKYPGRFVSMHVQGVDVNAPMPAPRGAGAPTGPGGPGGARRGGMPGLAVGKDTVDWPKVFAAAKTGGVKNYFIEQSWDLTVQSAAYLKTLNV
jgi:sugar phosphate isomerase/epimerase